MVDIHHHLLYGVDDGPTDLESSIELAEAAIRDGIRYVVCTPHANSRYGFSQQENQTKLGQIREQVGERLQLGLGCDLHLSFENIEKCMQDASPYTINGGSYLLVEFSDLVIPAPLSEVFFRMQGRNIIPIITHPERNPIFQGNSDLIAKWLHLGCLVQITAASITGQFGRSAQATAWKMLKHNWVHFVASDAHSAKYRPPMMGEAFTEIARNMNEETAELLCRLNPQCAVDNKPLPDQPEPLGPDEYANRSRGFFRKLWRG